MDKNLLDLSREIQAISKSGLAFSKDPFDVERFKQLEDIAAELISRHSIHSKDFINGALGNSGKGVFGRGRVRYP